MLYLIAKKEKQRALPSPSSVFRYLDAFHDPEQEQQREPHKAFIPEPTSHLNQLQLLNRYLVSAAQQHQPQTTATLDIDATLIESFKKQSLTSYKGFTGYQPINVYWKEQDLVVHTEFHDGNVPVGFEQFRILKESLENLPPGVEKVYHRSDSAGSQWDHMKYCAEGTNKRFGVIEFAVSVPVTDEFRQAVGEVSDRDWHFFTTTDKATGEEVAISDQQWAEVCFVPNAIATKKDGPTNRFLVVRELLSEQLSFPETEPEQLSFPFPTMELGTETSTKRYKITGYVTNKDLPGQELITWARQRCGKGEEVHGIIKNDLVGGKVPSSKFGSNAAWWTIAVMAFHCHTMMKRFVLGTTFATKRLKAIRSI